MPLGCGSGGYQRLSRKCFLKSSRLRLGDERLFIAGYWSTKAHQPAPSMLILLKELKS